jgi:hypothetical protein
LDNNIEIGINDIPAAVSLDYKAKLAALLEANGLRPAEIESKLEMKSGYVWRLKQREEYRELVGEFHAEIARKYVENSTDMVGLFNEQIGPSVATMIEIRDNRGEKAGDRLKASKEFLDRAPEAPKARREMESQGIVISIPISTMDGMKQALLEEGTKEDKEILELVEGKDWEEEKEEPSDNKTEKEIPMIVAQAEMIKVREM